jgi:hypothetical protein
MSKEQEEQLSFDHCSHSMVLISFFCIFLHVLQLVTINSYKPKEKGFKLDIFSSDLDIFT